MLGRMPSKIDGGSTDFASDNPGRDVQRGGTARFLGEDLGKIYDPVWAVIGTLGESQCYLGVAAKVAAVQAALSRRISRDEMEVRLVAPAFTLGVSDGQLNGTARMRYSLIGRELVHDTTEIHLRANDVAGAIAVVACDKPPVGTVAALLKHNASAVVFSDGSIWPGTDPETGERIDLVDAFQAAADPDDERRARIALHGCPGYGSCGGMYTYNTMQAFIAAVGLEPLHMVALPSDDDRRVTAFPDELVDCLVAMAERGIRPRDIVSNGATQRPRRRAGDGRFDECSASRRRDCSRRRASTSGPTSSLNASSTRFPAAYRCSPTCAPTVSTPWSTSTVRAGCKQSSASSCTPISSTAARSPAPGSHSQTSWADSTRHHPTTASSTDCATHSSPPAAYDS